MIHCASCGTNTNGPGLRDTCLCLEIERKAQELQKNYIQELPIQAIEALLEEMEAKADRWKGMKASLTLYGYADQIRQLIGIKSRRGIGDRVERR